MTEAQKELLQLKAELLRRKLLPLNLYVPDEDPEHNQLIIHKSNHKFKLVFGGNQSGKSLVAAAEIAWTLLGTHPYRPEFNKKPQKVWAISVEYRNLYEGIYRHIRPDGQDHNGMGFLPPESIIKEGPKVVGHDLPSYIEVKHSTGKKSIITFISAMGGMQGVRRVASAAVNRVFIDEEIDGDLFNELKVRLLATDGELLISASLIMSEPWITELEDLAESGHPDYIITRLNTAKNKHLTDRSVKAVFGNMSEEEKDVRLHGKSRRNQGLVYADFTDQHIIEPFVIPKEWPRYRALDPGYRVFAGLWIARDPETGNLFGYREMYLKNTNLDDVARFIKVSEVDEEITIGFIDPNAKVHMQDGSPSIITQLAMFHNIPCTPALNDELVGILSCHRLLNIREINGKHVPWFRIFSTCKEFIKERKGYKLSKATAVSNNDKPISKANHLMDCWKYLALFLIGHTMDLKMKSRTGRVLTPMAERQRQTEMAAMPSRTNKMIHPYLGSEF